jgi:hypothetical protein
MSLYKTPPPRKVSGAKNVMEKQGVQPRFQKTDISEFESSHPSHAVRPPRTEYDPWTWREPNPGAYRHRSFASRYSELVSDPTLREVIFSRLRAERGETVRALLVTASSAKTRMALANVLAPGNNEAAGALPRRCRPWGGILEALGGGH